MPLPPNTLNQALNQLPQLLLSLGKLQQDRRDEELRRDIQQASQEFQREMLERRMAVSKELEEFRAGLEQPKDPPEVSILGRRIEKDLDVLRDPNTALTLGKEEIDAVKSRVKGDVAKYGQLTGRNYPVDPSLLEVTKPPTPPPTLAAPLVVEEKPKPRIFESRDEYQARLKELGKAAPSAEAVAVEDIPPGFPDPGGFPEGQTATFNGEPWIIRNGQWMKNK